MTHQTKSVDLKRLATNPVHAYLFVGDDDVTQNASLEFAQALLCDSKGCKSCNSCQRVTTSTHPDVIVRSRTGAGLSVSEARDIVRMSNRTPRVGKYLIIIIPEVNLLDEAGPVLLKTLEEPVETTIFILLTKVVAPRLATIKSRCATVYFRSVKDDKAIEAESVWRDAVRKFEPTGNYIANSVDKLIEDLNKSVEDLKKLQQHEIDQFKSASSQGDSVDLRLVEERHKREIKRVRAERLKAGLGQMMDEYKSKLLLHSDNSASHPTTIDLANDLLAVDEINNAIRIIGRNPNEETLLRALLLSFVNDE